MVGLLAHVQTKQVRQMASDNWKQLDDAKESLERDIRIGKDFALYLRGFDIENPVAETVETDYGIFVTGYSHFRGFQNAIREVLPDGFPVYAIANSKSFDPSPSFKPVRVEDEDWKEAVRRYAGEARLIILLYNRKSPGVDEECALLCDAHGLSEKTWLILIAPDKKLSSECRKLMKTAGWVSQWRGGILTPEPRFITIGGSMLGTRRA